MASLRSAKKRARGAIIIARGIPVNRLYAYDKTFFKNGLPILQGITFPLKMKLFESGSIRLNEDAKALGPSRRSTDARNLSYALPKALD